MGCIQWEGTEGRGRREAGGGSLSVKERRDDRHALPNSTVAVCMEVSNTADTHCYDHGIEAMPVKKRMRMASATCWVYQWRPSTARGRACDPFTH